MKTRATQQRQVVAVNPRPIQKRIPRSPVHHFNVRSKPYEVTPLMIAPVLPGETLSSLTFNATMVSDPIKNSLIGWHHEYFFFYVKHRALSHWDTTGLLQSMMLDVTQTATALAAGANDTPYYTFKGGIPYMKACLQAVVNEYFRDEGEDHTTALLDQYPAVQIPQESWFHSIKKESAGADDLELPGVDEMEELDILPGFSTQYAQWELLRDANQTDLTYEDYLRSYGVSIPKSEDEGGTPDERHRPELLRHIRKFVQPANTINPADGVPASVLYGRFTESLEKRRYFKEPGFIIGLSVTRPKLYLSNQKGSAVGMLKDYLGWLPAVLQGAPYTSVYEVLDSVTDGILQNQTEDYWLDLKDLYIHGDQFCNYAMTAADTHAIALPSATLEVKYPTEPMVDTLFKTVGAEYIKQDGVCFVNVLGGLKDTTP